MRLTLALLGWELDVTLGLADAEPEFKPYQDAGATGSTAVGFTRAEVPWEDGGSLHQFEPEEC